VTEWSVVNVHRKKTARYVGKLGGGGMKVRNESRVPGISQGHKVAKELSESYRGKKEQTGTDHGLE